MRKFFLILMFTFQIGFAKNEFKKSQFDISKYYCKTNTSMKILKVSDSSLIFYGTEGGVLRTYDNGKTWLQNYTGLNYKEHIKEMIFSDGILFGVTNSGKVIISDDKGDYWKINKISNELTGITKFNNKLYCSSKNDSLYISSNNGISWEGFKLSVSNFYGLKSQNGKLIVIGYEKIYILNEDLSVSNVLNFPMSASTIVTKFDNLYLLDSSRITKLNNEFEWEIFNLNLSENKFTIYPENNIISIFSSTQYFDYGSENEPYYKYYEYDIAKEETKLISIFKSINFTLTKSNVSHFTPVDLEKNGSGFYLSCLNKTIFRVNESNWDVLSYSINGNSTCNYVDDSNLFFKSNFNASLLWSNNGGNTYNFTSSPTYTRKILNEIDTVSPYISDVALNSKGDNLIIFDEYGKRFSYSWISNSQQFGKFNVLSNKIDLLDIKILPPFITYGTSSLKIGKYMDYYYYTSTYQMVTKVVDPVSHASKDSLYFSNLYKINMNTFELDTVYRFVDSLKFINFYFEENKIWAVGCNTISKENIKLYLSTDNGKSFNLKKVFKLIKNDKNLVPEANITKSENGKIVIITPNQYIIVDEHDFTFKSVGVNLSLKLLKDNLVDYKLEDLIMIKLDLVDSIETFPVSYNQVELVNDSLVFYEMHSISNGNVFYQPLFAKDKKSMIFVYFQGIEKDLFFPIEPERIAYYNSVESIEPPSIWTFPPFPNPVNDEVKVKFFTGKMNEILNMQVNLIEISSGKSYPINKFEINKIDNFYGEILIPIDKKHKGAYLINFKLNKSNRTESIIIQ